MTQLKTRCPWSTINERMIEYHDTEWGVPQHDDRILFEYILLDSFQAGLSWDIILQKRENFRKAFDNFSFQKIAGYNIRKKKILLKDTRIVRNKLKIEAAVRNSQIFMDIQRECGSFDKYLWSFMNGPLGSSRGKPKKNKWRTLGQIPANTRDSDKISKDLYNKGFRFFGSTICYAFLQGAGLINDHLVSCFRHKEV